MFKPTALLALAGLLSGISAQQVGTNTAEVHPALTWYKHITAGSCVAQAGKVVLDANWPWLHDVGGSTNCYASNTWNTSLCPDAAICTTNCARDGADYAGTYGVSTSGNALNLKFVQPNSNGKNVGSPLYLMSDDSTYNIFKVMNQEFSFDVDVTQLSCALNGAPVFPEMGADGGMSKYPTNKAGTKYGIGYCDPQCPRDLKFIASQANSASWVGISANSGTGNYGCCCNEMGIGKANSTYKPHPRDAAAGVCDPDGCDFKLLPPLRHDFSGPAKVVDTTKKFTVATQFITYSGTATGNLFEIPRSIACIPAVNSVTEAYCDAQKSVFGDTTSFQNHGGLTAMGKPLARGGVLVLSVWDDYAVNMLWLDSTYPTDCTKDGCFRGTCASPLAFLPMSSPPLSTPPSSTPTSVLLLVDHLQELPSTTTTTTTKSSSSSTTTSTTSSANGTTQTHWGQCAGQGYTGPTNCESPYTRQYSNTWYSQCL